MDTLIYEFQGDPQWSQKQVQECVFIRIWAFMWGRSSIPSPDYPNSVTQKQVRTAALEPTELFTQNPFNPDKRTREGTERHRAQGPVPLPWTPPPLNSQPNSSRCLYITVERISTTPPVLHWSINFPPFLRMNIMSKMSLQFCCLIGRLPNLSPLYSPVLSWRQGERQRMKEHT